MPLIVYTEPERPDTFELQLCLSETNGRKDEEGSASVIASRLYAEMTKSGKRNSYGLLRARRSAEVLYVPARGRSKCQLSKSSINSVGELSYA